ncbi:MAG: polysaccharide biosynthesis/export family protein, partial [Planctomycetota bacterium]
PPGREVSVVEARPAEDPGPLFAGGDDYDPVKRRKVFRLGVSDVITVQVANHPEFSGDMVVDGMGTVTLPTVFDKVRAEGVDLDQLSDMISERVARFTRTPPRVTVKVLEVRSRYFYALGALGFQGQVPMGTGQVKLRDALVRAGLFIDGQSDTRRVMVITPDTEKPSYVVVNARDVLLGNLKNNVVIKPGDVVYVPNTPLHNFNRITDLVMRQINSIQDVDRAVTFIETLEDGVVPRDLDRGRIWVTRGGRKDVAPPESENTEIQRSFGN